MIGSINNTHGIQKPLPGISNDPLLSLGGIGSPSNGRIGTGKEKS
jgi:hypothetical protein